MATKPKNHGKPENTINLDHEYATWSREQEHGKSETENRDYDDDFSILPCETGKM